MLKCYDRNFRKCFFLECVENKLCFVFRGFGVVLKESRFYRLSGIYLVCIYLYLEKVNDK